MKKSVKSQGSAVVVECEENQEAKTHSPPASIGDRNVIRYFPFRVNYIANGTARKQYKDNKGLVDCYAS